MYEGLWVILRVAFSFFLKGYKLRLDYPLYLDVLEAYCSPVGLLFNMFKRPGAKGLPLSYLALKACWLSFGVTLYINIRGAY